MNPNSVVQIKSKGILDKSLNGCIGFVKQVNGNTISVNIYHPQEQGKNAFVKTYDIPSDNLVYIGEPELKPV